MEFRDSLLRGKIDGLKRNIAITEKISNNTQRVESLKLQLAAAEAERQRLMDSK